MEALLRELIGELRQELKQDIGGLRQELGEVRQELGEVRQELGEVRQELRQELGEVKGSIVALREETTLLMQQQWRDLSGAVSALGREMRQDFLALRQDLATVHVRLDGLARADRHGDEVDQILEERVASLESRVSKLESERHPRK